jgi:phage replication-related protein YjqB (UPF0714/DUF867 family)
MADHYRDFNALMADKKIEGVHYRIRIADLGTPIVVIAPHGGKIEPGTSEVAAAIAVDQFSLYCFEGVQKEFSGDLHITSEHFDEPQACRLVHAADTVVAVHGRVDRDDPRSTWLGGLDQRRRDKIAESLEAAGFAAKTTGHVFPGQKPSNICNRGRSGAGIQLELPKCLRDQLRRDSERLSAFADAVRRVLTSPPS